MLILTALGAAAVLPERKPERLLQKLRLAAMTAQFLFFHSHAHMFPQPQPQVQQQAQALLLPALTH